MTVARALPIIPAPVAAESARRPILWCGGCRVEGCSCFHPPHDGNKHAPGCELGKYVPPPARKRGPR